MRIETNNNEFMKSPAGITSVSSETQGSLGVTKKTTITFIAEYNKALNTRYSILS